MKISQTVRSGQSNSEQNPGLGVRTLGLYSILSSLLGFFGFLRYDKVNFASLS